MDEPFGVAGLEAFWTLDLEPTAESEPAMLPTERTVPAERSGRARTWVRFHADGELHGVDVRGREVESWRMRWHLEGDAQDRVVLSALEGEGSPYAGSVLCRRAPNLLESCGEQRNLVLRRLPADPRRPSVIPYPRRLSGALIGAQSQAILSCYRSVLGSCRDDAAAAGSADSADSADPAAPARPAGRIVMDLRVRTDASVEISIREDTLGSEGVVDCIRDILLGIDFPRPVGADLTLDAPLVFDVAPSPEGGDGDEDAAATHSCTCAGAATRVNRRPFGPTGIETLWMLDTERSMARDPDLSAEERAALLEGLAGVENYFWFRPGGELHWVDVRDGVASPHRGRWRHGSGSAEASEEQVLLSYVQPTVTSGETSRAEPSEASEDVFDVAWQVCRKAEDLLQSCGSHRTMVLRRLSQVSSNACEAEIPRSLIQGLFRSGRASLRRCYESALRAEPTLAGLLRVRVELWPGHRQDVRLVSDDVGSETLAACVIGTVEEIVFPPTGCGVTVIDYPFSFSLDD